MLTVRHVLTATLAVAALSLVGIAFSLWRAMEPGQLGGDTYGTRSHGQRGVFELLSELKVPVERSLLPPDVAANRPRTLVIWEPHLSLVQLEPVYLQQISRWVHSGGRLVVALPRPDNDEIFPSTGNLHKPEHEISILDELGLPKVRTVSIDLDEPEDAPKAQDGDRAATNTSPIDDKKVTNDARDRELFVVRDPKAEAAPTTCGGSLSDWQSDVARLEVSQHELQVLDTTADEPAGWLKIKTADGQEQTLVASYRVGEGEILLVSDGELCENRLLGQADNSLLAWRLLVAPGRAVLWDEFYHGLTIRGNPLYLLRREPFGALMAAILILISVCIWRQAVRFGPPTVIPPPSRRTIAEYIETMARLFQGGRGSQPFLLDEIRGGTLWFLRSKLRLNLGQEKLETIVAVLQRKHPAQAARLADAVRGIDQTLAAGRDLPAHETVLTLQRISACL